MLQQNGGYVHYYTRGYERYGINYPRGSTVNANADRENTIRMVKRNIRTRAEKLQKKENKKYMGKMEEYLSAFFFNKEPSGGGEMMSLILQARDKIDGEILSNIDKTIGVDWSKGGQLYWKTKGDSQYSSYLKYNDTELRKQTITDLENKVKEMKDFLNTRSSQWLSDKTLEEKRKLVTDVINQLEKMANSESGKTYLTVKDDKELIKKINSIAAANRLPSSKVYGQYGEYIGSVCNEIINNGLTEKIADSVVKEALDRGVTGARTTNFSQKLTGFFDNRELETQLSNKTTTKLSQNVDGTLNLVYNNRAFKADIMIEIDENKYNSSVKNYKTLNNGIHLSSSLSLGQLFGDEDPRLLYHYMNLVANNQESGKNYSVSLKGIYPIIKQLALLKGLAGTKVMSGEGSANYFIVINRSEKKVYIKNIGELVNKIIKSGESINNIVSVTGGNIYKLPQSWVGDKKNKNEQDARKRVSILYANVHAKKLDISLTGTDFLK